MYNVFLKFQMLFMHKLYVDLINSIENDYEYWKETKRVEDRGSYYKLTNSKNHIEITCKAYTDYMYLKIGSEYIDSDFAEYSHKVFSRYIFNRKLQKIAEYKHDKTNKLNQIQIKTRKKNPEEFI